MKMIDENIINDTICNYKIVVYYLFCIAAYTCEGLFFPYDSLIIINMVSMICKSCGFYKLSICSSFVTCTFTIAKTIVIFGFLNCDNYVIPFIICDYTLSLTYSVLIAHGYDSSTQKVLPYPRILYKDIKTNIHMSCSICLEDFKINESAKLTECNHVFHEKCIKEWFISKQTCPMCRSSIMA